MRCEQRQELEGATVACGRCEAGVFAPKRKCESENPVKAWLRTLLKLEQIV